jgi:hypothetical protein
MFGWGKKPTSQPDVAQPRGGDPVIAAALMEGDSFPLAKLQTILSKTPIAGQTASDINTNKGILSFQLGDEWVFIAPMPAPYPWATSWMWPKEKPATTLERHRSHALVTLMKGKSDPISRRLTLMHVTAAVAGLPGVMGIYWPDATLAHYPPIFIQMAQKLSTPDRLPLYLLVDFRVFRNQDNSFGLFTTGLRPLGHMEIEIPRMNMKPSQLREWGMNIAYYVMNPANKIKDGDTIGMSAEQKIRIRHVPSSFGGKGVVMRLET